MIDIHTHILPGVDDGARDLKEALSMARIAVADGITHLFATSHHDAREAITWTEVKERVERLQAELVAAHIPLTVLPGHEVRLHEYALEHWQRQLAGPLGRSRYVLAEPLFHDYGPATEALLFELFEQGYIPVMAHPERIRSIQDDLSLIEPFLERGGLTQITSHSLTGYHGSRAKEVAEAMLQRGMVHVIASDAHHDDRRTPALAMARDLAAKIVGPIQAEAMVTANPQAILNDQPVVVETVAA